MKETNGLFIPSFWAAQVGVAFRHIPCRISVVVHMRTFTAVIERCPDTGLFVGYVPGFPGAHSQGATLDELQQNMAEVIRMLLEDGEPHLESEFIGTQKVQVA
jgi:predicted RNase H-like HicB family nuclease